jgi:hypothetical protein
MLIDKIILSKIKDFTPDECTGGGIQISGSRYTKSLNISLVIYFGYTTNRNSISRKIKIKEEDISVLSKELLLKTKKYLDSVNEEEFILDISEILEETSVKTSYETSTNLVRGCSKDSDSVDSVDSGREKEHFQPSSSEIMKAWNDYANDYGFSAVKTINDNRRKSFLKLIKDYGVDDIEQAIDNASQSNFLRGIGEKAMFLTFDWFVKPSNFIKILEGNYNNRNKK